MLEKLKATAKYLVTFPWIRRPAYWIFKAFEIASGYRIEKYRFKKRTGYDLQLDPPRSFSEKIVYKKLFDRNLLLTKTADKYRVREYVKEQLGKERASEILIPLLYVTDNPETIPFDTLPDEYIIKANHGSGTNIIIKEGDDVDRQQVISTCKQWLAQPYGLFKHEWAYQGIDRKIIIEKLLRNNDGTLPKDHKFHVFNGTTEFIQVDFNRHTNEQFKRTLLTRDWQRIDASLKYPQGPNVDKPDTSDMLEIAENLAESLDYARVDLYNTDNGIYFGEITHYPGDGRVKITPTSFDFELGEKLKVFSIRGRN
jgi:hypothetical protein